MRLEEDDGKAWNSVLYPKYSHRPIILIGEASIKISAIISAKLGKWGAILFFSFPLGISNSNETLRLCLKRETLAVHSWGKMDTLLLVLAGTWTTACNKWWGWAFCISAPLREKVGWGQGCFPWISAASLLKFRCQKEEAIHLQFW